MGRKKSKGEWGRRGRRVKENGEEEEEGKEEWGRRGRE